MNGHHRATFTRGEHSMEEKLEQAKEFLVNMPKEKAPRALPRYVFKYKTGLLVYFKKTARRPTVWKHFLDGTAEEQLAQVLPYLETFRQQGFDVFSNSNLTG